MQYLYGASVQGIQQFIFSTNKLREISGASEIVESICTDMFRSIVDDFDEDRLIIGAAGNIKYLFNDRQSCAQVVKQFPKMVMEHAPGITISQACIELPNGMLPDSMDSLEERVNVQRNRQVAQHGSGWMVSERSRQTGEPASELSRGEWLSKAQTSKRSSLENGTQRLLKKILPRGMNLHPDYQSREMEHLLGGAERGWIAVVHADGNGLGQRIIDLSHHFKDHGAQEQIPHAFREMSLRLEQATVAAARVAFSVLDYQQGDKLPIRPVVLGGDDLTVIMDGRKALAYTEAFLKHFEDQTRQHFQGYREHFGTGIFENGLTACAGIAFVKPNYPFHYAVELSETLCKQAKHVSKKYDGSPSSLQFHKVHSGYVESYSDIVARELSAGNVRFDYGPYFVHQAPNHYNTTSTLFQRIRIAGEKNAPAAPIREWLNELKVNPARAAQFMDRIRQLDRGYYTSRLGLDVWKVDRPGPGVKSKFCRECEAEHASEAKSYTHLYDVISMLNLYK